MADLFGEDATPKLRSSYSPGFEKFWQEYPKTRRKDKRKAFLSWQKQELEGHANTLVSDIQRRKDGDKDWRKDGGKYVPLPTTYLNGRRWEDELVEERIAGRASSAQGKIQEERFEQTDPFKRAINRVMLIWAMRKVMATGRKFTEAQQAEQFRVRDMLAEGLRQATERGDSLDGFEAGIVDAMNGTL